MLEFLVNIFGGIVGFFTGVLPQSPFQNLSIGDNVGVGTALGWLNWFVPVGDMAGIFTIWLVAAMTVGVVNFIFKKAIGVIGGVSGGGE